jgi:hypothetical protein
MDRMVTQILPPEVTRQIAEDTQKWRAPAGLANAHRNLPFIRHSVLDLQRDLNAPVASAIVVAAGPSLRRQNIVARLKALERRPLLICCDGALASCLRADLVPDVVVSLDPHPDRIVRWFGDRNLRSRPDDDYYRRQDLDIDLRSMDSRAEEAKNREVLALVDRYGSRLRAALSTSVALDVTERCIESGMPLYWWNPLYDDWSNPESYTRRVFELTGGIPCMTGLGHCGGAAWVLAHAVLGASRVGIVGMDLGYPDGTSVVNTQYYEFVRHLPSEQAERFLVRMDNPHTGTTYLTDPVYYWYRETLLDAVRRADCTTVNCSGEGTLFGQDIVWDTVEQFAA